VGLLRIACILVIAALTIISFWHPRFASWTFLLIFILLIEGYSFLLVVLARKHSRVAAGQAPHFFSEDEAELVTKFAAHFRYPGITNELSLVVAANALAAVIFVPVLIYKTMYVEAALIGLNWFLAGPLSYRLSPLDRLNRLSAAGHFEGRLLAAWDSSWEKILAAMQTRSTPR